MSIKLPQLITRPYRVTENAPLAQGMFRLVLEAEDPKNAMTPFQAGQWAYLHLLNPDGSTWARAAYSIASAPRAGTRHIELAIKVEGDFTQRAQTLKPGDRVQLQGPWGVFTLGTDVKSHALFAGGIGVTPFLSMVREAAATNAADEIRLLYSNHTVADSAYLDELRQIAAAHPGVTLIPICTRETPPAWEGETRRIDAAMLDRHLASGADEYLLCGSREFMDTVRTLLAARGVEKKRIKQESFG